MRPVFPRCDSRHVLKAVIAFNVFLVFYQIINLKTNNERVTPCVVFVNVSKPESQQLLQFEFASIKSPRANEVWKWSQNNSIAVKREMRDRYSVIRNFIPSETLSSIAFNESVTLSTQGTFEFLFHAEQLCLRWRGPISLAVYAPGNDFFASINVIYYLRLCSDPCVRRYVSWHLIFDRSFGPPLQNVSSAENYVNFAVANCSLTFKDILSIHDPAFRKQHKLPYPINVARNVARLSSRTKYLLASDIELYPSVEIIPMFLNLLEREVNSAVPLSYLKENVPHVYVLPIFEVKASLSAPFNKSDLAKMVEKGDAIFFHKWVCDACQNFPDRSKWITSLSQNNSLNVFRSTKRLANHNAWEPLYIGTNLEPLYEERLSWEGKRDKMSQMFEMCLLNYDLLILDNAFLVHSPGIKHIDPKDERRRLPFIKRNNVIYNTLISKLRQRYGKNNKC